MGWPSISVALCTFNGAKFLPRQLESICGQSRLPDEIIISDDNSTDRSRKILLDFEKNAPCSVRLIFNRSRIGAIKNFEQAMSLAKCQFIALCDQDDIWNPDKLEMFESRLDFRNQSGPALFFSDFVIGDESGQAILLKNGRKKDSGINRSMEWQDVCLANRVPGCTMIVDRRIVQRALPFPESVIMHDWWLMLIATLSAKTIRIEHPTMLYRLHPGNTCGLPSTIGGLLAGIKTGMVGTAQGNFSAVIKQLRDVKERLDELGLEYPKEELARICGVPMLPFYERPLVLQRSGLRRSSKLKLFFSLAASMLVSEKVVAGRPRGYR